MSEEMFTSIFRVGKFKCQLSVSTQKGMHAEWSPDVPKSLSKKEWREYRSGRDALFNEVAKHIGGRVVVVEV